MRMGGRSGGASLRGLDLDHLTDSRLIRFDTYSVTACCFAAVTLSVT